MNFSIESHTHSHLDSRELTEESFETECQKSDQIILHNTGCHPKYFAFPFGHHNAMTRDVVRRRYRASVSTELETLHLDCDSAALPRIDSYYLKSKFMIEHIDSLSSRLYLKLRSNLRTISHSQVRAPRVAAAQDHS